MLKFFLLVALSVGAQGGLLTPIFDICSVSDLIDAADTIIEEFQRRISDGLEIMPLGFNEACNTPLITFPEGLTLNAGIVTLPLPFLCSQPKSSLIYRLICRLGAADCTYVHNKYSGKCAVVNVTDQVPDTSQNIGQVFVCNDANPHGFDFTNLSAQCGPLLGVVLDDLLDTAFKKVLRTRFAVDLCPPSYSDPHAYNSIGCNSDCRNNHQYASGVCTTGNTPTAVFTGEVNAGFQCICAPLT